MRCRDRPTSHPVFLLEYGLVFGIFELTVFVASPLIGSKINGWGARRVFNLGIFTTGFCSILFGMLDRFDDPHVFIGLSFVVRVVEAVGNSAFLTSSFTIIAREFPENVGAMFATLETFFGMGLIVGPTVGGGLYQVLAGRNRLSGLNFTSHQTLALLAYSFLPCHSFLYRQ